jgi:hypothetical protein
VTAVAWWCSGKAEMTDGEITGARNYFYAFHLTT